MPIVKQFGEEAVSDSFESQSQNDDDEDDEDEDDDNESHGLSEEIWRSADRDEEEGSGFPQSGSTFSDDGSQELIN